VEHASLASTATHDRPLAEEAFAYRPCWPTQQREQRQGYVVSHGPNPHHLYGLALRLRFEAHVESVVAEVREWFAARDRREFTWLVGDLLAAEAAIPTAAPRAWLPLRKSAGANGRTLKEIQSSEIAA
jgi:hypothetical protein